jgi:DHA2 family multidrug resistance protein
MKTVVTHNKWLVALSVSLGTLLATLSSTTLNIALPTLRGSLGASLQEITWVITGFATANICIMPLTGFLSRRFGQKRIYLVALGLFLGCSLLCGMARSLPLLVILRVLQGVGAGALIPTEQALLQQAFPPSQQGVAISASSMIITLGTAAGPIVGGLLVDQLSWPWVFFVNLPIGLLGLAMVATFVHVPRQLAGEARRTGAAPESVDWWGLLLLPASLAGVQVLLSQGNHWGWLEPGSLALALAAVFGLLLFAHRELTVPAPAVHLRLFKEPFFLFGTVLGGSLYAMLIASQYLLPIFMQEMLGLTATQAAIALLSRVAVSVVVTPVLGRFHGVLPPRFVLAAGALAFGVSCLQISTFTLRTDVGHIAAVVAVQGVGLSVIGVTLTTFALSRIPPHEKVDASGLHMLVRHICGALGLTLFAALLTRDTIISRTALLAHVSAGRLEVVEFLRAETAHLTARGLAPGAVGAAAMSLLDQTVHREAMLLAFKRLFLLIGLLFLGVIPLALLFRQGTKSQRT